MYANVNPAPGYSKHPDHEVHVVPFRGTIAVHADATKIAESSSAVLVTESNHAPVYYFPIEDVNPDYLRDSSHITRCPFKGKARFWNVRVGNHEIDNTLWSYELPYDEVLELAGLVAFFANKVTIDVKPE